MEILDHLLSHHCLSGLGLLSLVISVNYDTRKLLVNLKMNYVIRKMAFCLCENKDADQLCSN